MKVSGKLMVYLSLSRRENKRGASIDLRHAIDKIPNHGTMNHHKNVPLNYSCGVIFQPCSAFHHRELALVAPLDGPEQVWVLFDTTI